MPLLAVFFRLICAHFSRSAYRRWVFEGFLPVNKKQKRERLAELQGEKRTVIFYEAPHKLRTTLDDLTTAFGTERSITLCRELTKLHEEIWKTTLGEAQAHYAGNEPRGEYVLVMAGAPACFGMRMQPPDASTAARSHTLSTPVTLCTKGDGVNGPGSARSCSAE